MKKISLILITLIVSTSVFADKHKHMHKHGKSLSAHEHGTLKLEMAVEGKVIELNIDGPAESFIGFEYLPKTDKEKKTFTDAESLWTKDLLTKLIVLDSKLGCTLSEATFKQEIESEEKSGTHSDIEAMAKITCAQDLKGQSLTVNLKKHFPNIKKLSAELVGSEIKTIDIKSKAETIKL